MYLAVVHLGQVLENRHSRTKSGTNRKLIQNCLLQNEYQNDSFLISACLHVLLFSNVSRLTSSRKETGQAIVLATSLQSRAVHSPTVQ